MDRRNGPLNSAPTPPTEPVSQLIKRAFGYLLAFAGLIWVFHDIHVEELLQNITSLNGRWVALAIVFDILSYLCQGLRWQLLLRPVGPLSLLRTTQAIYVGLFTNEVLPMRLGELVRAYLVSRWLSVELVSVLPSMVVERWFDGVWLALAVGLTALFVQLPKNLLEAGDLLGILVLLAAGLFIYIVFRGQKTPEDRVSGKFSWKPLCSALSFVEGLVVELRNMGLSRYFYMAFSVSLFILILQALAFWLVMWAYGLRLSFWVGAVVFLVVHLGTAIPNAPANVGTYQFFCVVGLTLFGVEKTQATGFSLVVFALLTLPLWAIGFLALSHSGMTLAAIRNEIHRWRAR